MSDETQVMDNQETQLATQQQQVDANETVKQNGHTDENSTTMANMSNLCLQLISNAAKSTIFPLNIGLTTFGRSKSSDISLIHKSVSRNHGCIQIDQNEDTVEVRECFLIDHGSLNKTKLNGVELTKEDKNAVNLTDQIEIGALKFKLEKMTEDQLKEQQLNRNKSIDLQELQSPNKSKPGLLEIQNTMEETVLIEDEKSQAFNEDTEPEDNNLDNTSCPDFRLHMSASFINQSVVSNKSMVIPETMAVEEEEEENCEAMPQAENQPSTEASTNPPPADPNPETDTVVVAGESSETIDAQQEPKEHKDETELASTDNKQHTEVTEDLPDSKSSAREDNQTQSKAEEEPESVETDQPADKQEQTAKTTSAEKKEPTETKSDFEVKKYNSLNDESIIINDDDEDDINMAKLDTQKNIIVAETDKMSDEIIVESTLMDTSAKSQPVSQLSETEPSQVSPAKEAPVRRGRGRPRSSVGAKQHEKPAPEPKVQETETARPRRSTRTSLPPQTVEQEDTENMTEEEKPDERPKVGRRSSLRVRNTANPVGRPKRAAKLLEEEAEEKDEQEAVNRRKSVGAGLKKSEEKNRRKTVDPSQVAQVPKRRVGRPRLVRESDPKSSPKRKSDENENLSAKKIKNANDEESSDDEDNETLDNVKKMLRKKSEDGGGDAATPKIFFNSKRRKTPNSSLNHTPKTNDNADTPSKKFKLHKAISSSDENLNQSSADEAVEKPLEDQDQHTKTHDDKIEQNDSETREGEKQEDGKDEKNDQDEHLKAKNTRKVNRTASSRLPVAATRHSTRTNRNQ